MRKKRLTAALMLVLLLTACGGGGAKTDLMRGVTAREITAEPVSDDLTDLDAAVTGLGLELLRRGGEGNVLVSPLSVAYALSMTANGAKGETLAQMEAVLGMPVEMLNFAFHEYLNALPEGEKNTLHLANSVWFTDKESFAVNQDFLQTNADYYGADIYQTALDDSAKAAINGWVKENTRGMIPEIVDQIPQSAVMYLVNALAFEAEWWDIYEEHQVRKGTFTTEDGETQKTELMWSAENFYMEDENAAGFLKFYDDGEYAFAALLPGEGVSVADYAGSLTGESLHTLLKGAENTPVTAAIPKFESEFDCELSEVLAEMGMPVAFDHTAADFSGLGTSTEGNIAISRVLHKTYINVDEKGTKAGAATAVEMTEESAEVWLDPKEVILDRPFLYMIVDCEQWVPLFMGTLMELD